MVQNLKKAMSEKLSVQVAEQIHAMNQEQFDDKIRRIMQKQQSKRLRVNRQMLKHLGHKIKNHDGTSIRS